MTLVRRLKSTASTLGQGIAGVALGLGLFMAISGQPAVAFAETLAPSPVAVVQPAASEGPRLWVVRDADSTIYLFGTVHLLKPETQWRTDRVQRAFDSASEVWLEYPDVDNPAAVAGVMQQHAMSPERPLQPQLTEAEYAQVVSIFGQMGLPEPAANAARPWFAAMMLTVAAVTKAGYDPQSGGELVIKKLADAAGKPVRGFETAEQQIRMLAGMPEETQLAFLRSTLQDYAKAETMMDRLVSTWAAGDMEGFQPLVVDELKSQSEDLYQAILVRRNADWTNQIQTLLEGSGVVFIAVGAGHLVGPDSVQAMLEARGVEVDEVQ